MHACSLDDKFLEIDLGQSNTPGRVTDSEFIMNGATSLDVIRMHGARLSLRERNVSYIIA